MRKRECEREGITERERERTTEAPRQRDSERKERVVVWHGNKERGTRAVMCVYVRIYASERT